MLQVNYCSGIENTGTLTHRHTFAYRIRTFPTVLQDLVLRE